MEGRQGRGRPRTRARNPIENSPTEAVDRRSDAEPAGGQGRDRDLDDRLIAAYERGRQAERRDATPEVHEGAPEEFRRLYDSFTRLNPPRFDGTGEYAAAEEWLASMNAKLILCRAPDEDKVELAEQQLESDARFWWNGARRSYVGEEAKISWEWFEQQFTRRFLSNLQREALRRKFLDLRQNGRAVADYNNEFLALSRYATDVQIDVARYHRQYLDGLDGGISMIVDTPMATELQAMMDHAEQVELHSRRRRMQLTERNVKQREDQNRQIRSRGGPSTAKPPPRQIATPVLQPDFVSRWCRSCNQAHHEQDCRRRNRACYTCGSLEHFARECPQAAGPSTARPPPRQIATRVLQPDFVSRWCRSCNQAHPEQDCRRRSRACYTCGSLEHFARECPQAASGFLTGRDVRGPAGRGQSGPPSQGRGIPQHSGGRTGGRVSAHALGVSEVAHDAAETQADVMTGNIYISD